MKVPALKMPNFKSADAQLLAVGVVALVVVYIIGKKLVTAGAQVVGGVVSGNNAVTAGTPYQGTGVLGTLGAATNDASGGFLGTLGGDIGDGLFDLFNGSGAPAATQTNSAGSTLQDGGATGSW